VRKASCAAVAASALLVVLIAVLFMKLLAAKVRHSIAVLKSLGFTVADIRRKFMIRSLMVAAVEMGTRVVVANGLGELAGGRRWALCSSSRPC
jgi:putative ABC transport system permease protein